MEDGATTDIFRLQVERNVSIVGRDLNLTWGAWGFVVVNHKMNEYVIPSHPQPIWAVWVDLVLFTRFFGQKYGGARVK
jgi:hypothetical protein